MGKHSLALKVDSQGARPDSHRMREQRAEPPQ